MQTFDSRWLRQRSSERAWSSFLLKVWFGSLHIFRLSKSTPAQGGANFMLPGVIGGDGDPFHPGVTGLQKQGADWKRAACSLRGFLKRFGLSPEQAQMYTPHSARHVLAHVAARRGEPEYGRAELGAWLAPLCKALAWFP